MCYLCVHPQFCSEAAQGRVPFSVVFLSDLVQGYAVEQAEAGGCDVWLQELRWLHCPPEIWAASVADFSQDMSTRSSAKLWCGVGRAEVLTPLDWEVW